ncbi:hypothetical protein NDU88_005773 [Pleurodeles waltl]|uniref:Uncharacterized protein n=1 Tax=Pleurodeles waltl TaxID=8319 RepID=A0AAV7W8S1_PLEWA|nr:hypothetical protein NDU88_005773 [Pleurodeles waltl]
MKKAPANCTCRTGKERRACLGLTAHPSWVEKGSPAHKGQEEKTPTEEKNNGRNRASKRRHQMRGGNHGITCPNRKAEPATKPKWHQAKEPHPEGTKGPKKTQKIRRRRRRSTRGPSTPETNVSETGDQQSDNQENASRQSAAPGRAPHHRGKSKCKTPIPKGRPLKNKPRAGKLHTRKKKTKQATCQENGMDPKATPPTEVGNTQTAGDQ